MRACVLVLAALALWPPPAAAGPPPLDHVRRQILAKLGLSSRPTLQRAPPRDVVRQILARAADPAPPRRDADSDREVIAIAQRGRCQYSVGWLCKCYWDAANGTQCTVGHRQLANLSNYTLYWRIECGDFRLYIDATRDKEAMKLTEAQPRGRNL